MTYWYKIYKSIHSIGSLGSKKWEQGTKSFLSGNFENNIPLQVPNCSGVEYQEKKQLNWPTATKCLEIVFSLVARVDRLGLLAVCSVKKANLSQVRQNLVKRLKVFKRRFLRKEVKSIAVISAHQFSWTTFAKLNFSFFKTKIYSSTSLPITDRIVEQKFLFWMLVLSGHVILILGNMYKIRVYFRFWDFTGPTSVSLPRKWN